MLDPDAADTVLLELLNEPEYESVAATALLKLAPDRDDRAGIWKEKKLRELWEARVRLRPGVSTNHAGLVILLYLQAESLLSLTNAPLRKSRTVRVSIEGIDKGAGRIRCARLYGSDPARPSNPERVTSWWWSSLEILETLLFNGIVLPSAETLKWFNAILEKVRPHRYDSQQVAPLLQALCLLPFIDAPPVGIAKIGEVIAQLKFFAHQLRGVRFPRSGTAV